MKESIQVKRNLILLVAACFILLLAVSFLSGCEKPYNPYTFVGEGTKENPYKISTKEDLIGLRTDVENKYTYFQKYFVLTSDIDLGGMVWAPIGTKDSSLAACIDGDGYTISNFKIENPTTTDCGFFANIWIDNNISDPAIKDLNISNATLIIKNNSTIAHNAALLIGSTNGKIVNCNVTGTIDVENSYFSSLGMVIGNSQKDVENCVSDGEIKIKNPEYDVWHSQSQGVWFNIGGVVGNSNASIVSCTNRADFNEDYILTDTSRIDAKHNNGGITGSMNSANSFIRNCVNEGNINGIGRSAGIAANLYKAVVENCLNTGNISSKSELSVDTGGIVGSGSESVVRNCKNTGDVTITTKGRWWNGEVVIDGNNSNYYEMGTVGGVCASGGIDIYYCVNTGDVTATGECIHYPGGIVGRADGDIYSSYSTGNVTGYSKYTNVMAAGITAVVEGNTQNGNIKIENCFSTGFVQVLARAITDVHAGLAGPTPYAGGCFAYIHTTANTLKNNVYVTNPSGTLDENHFTFNSWYSDDDEENSISSTISLNRGVTMEELTSGNPLAGFGTYIDAGDLIENPENVWIYTEGELPKLYWED